MVEWSGSCGNSPSKSPAMLLFRVRFLQLLLFATATNRVMAEMSSRGYGGDESALVSFKEKISSHSGVLDSWNQSTGYCSWEGVICSKRHPWRVVTLNLSSQGLIGTISPAIGNLTFLRSLNLSTNTLQGEIPPSIGGLGRLEILDLNQNMLIGVIPGNISRCTSLFAMSISRNMGLRGSIPYEIGNMQSLSALVLANNSISRTIPSSFGNLSQLFILSLSMNHLEGSIPSGIVNNPYLNFLQLSHNNLSGLLPPLYNLSSLGLLDVSGNNLLAGRIPYSIGNLANLMYIDFSECFLAGVIPESIGNLTRLEYLDLESNNLSGRIPSSIGNLTRLSVFVARGNSLMGPISE
ncbi:unnamed protein product [Urochloa humidicola]